MNTQAKSSKSLTLNYMGREVGGDKHLSFSALRHFFAIYANQSNHKNHSSDIIKRDKKIAQRKRNIGMK